MVISTLPETRARIVVPDAIGKLKSLTTDRPDFTPKPLLEILTGPSSDPLQDMHRFIEKQHPWLEQHMVRSGEKARGFARHLWGDALTANRIARAAYHHELGMLALSPELIEKEGVLNEEERLAINTTGEILSLVYSHLAATAAPEYQTVLNIYQDLTTGFQEHWDGNGHPSGAKGR